MAQTTRRSSSGTTVITLAICLLVAGSALPAPSSQPRKSGGPPSRGEHVLGEVLVKFRPSLAAGERDAIRSKLGAARTRRFRGGAEHWNLRHGMETGQAIARLRADPRVEYAEPNYLVHADRLPNDPRLPEIWGLRNTGQGGGLPGADIRAELVWNIGTGSRTVRVAVIDTGIDYTHPDLAANIWSNPGEIPANGIDDDHNGFIDDVRGWDFVNDDNDPRDDMWHGTHVAGIIGAVGNNGTGIVGVNWEVSLIPLKFLNAGGTGTTADAVAAVEYAASLHADVINASWSGGDYSQTLYDAIAASGSLFVAAAGNDGLDNDSVPHYPANYELPNVIAVAATDRFDHKAGFSDWGATTVDLGAPGVDILSTVSGGGYAFSSGTSMAAPHVSGAAALIRAAAPGLGPAQIKQRMLEAAEPIPALAGITASGGRLNAFLPIAEPDPLPPGAIVDLSAGDPASNSLVLTWTATGDDGDVGTASFYDLRYTTTAIDDAGFESATPVQNAPLPGPSGGTEIFEVGGLSPDTVYFFAIKARDEWGNAGPMSNVAPGRTLPPPTLSTSPGSFSVALLSGQTTTRTLTIENAGEGTLDWRIPQPEQANAGAGQAFSSAALAKGVSDPRVGPPVVDGRGGPDGFGYAFSDSDQPGGPAFDWIDIAASGTPIAGLQDDDRTSEPIPLGFEMPFYDNVFDSVRVSTNGFLSFTSSRADYANQPLPSPVAPENLVAPFWDDLDLSARGSVVYAADGASFTVQYTGVGRFDGPGECTFQVTLHQSGAIVFRYLSITAETESVTVGIQDSSGTVGLNVAFNTRYVHDLLAVRIVPPARWLTVAPSAGRLSAGESQDVTLTLDAQGLEAGGYAASLFVESNDPLRSRVDHPVGLDVTGAPAIKVRPALLDFGTVFSGFERTLELTVYNVGTELLTVREIASYDPIVTVAPSSFTLSARAQTRVAVTYAPGSPGVLDSTLSIASDASNSPNLLIGVTGLSAPAPEIGATPSAFNESLLTGGTSTRKLTIGNGGGSALVVHLTSESEWLRVAPVDGIIAPGESRDFDVVFDADGLDAGVLLATVRIDTNIPNLPVLRVPATLTVIGAPNIGTSPERLDFGPVYVGYGKSLELTVLNEGPEPLEVMRVESDQPEFTFSPPALNLPAKGSGRITVTLTASSARSFAAALRLESNDPDSPVLSVALAGVGVQPPVIGVDPAALQATLHIGEQETQSLAIRNGGPSLLHFSLGVQPRAPGAAEQGAVANCLPTRVLVSEFGGNRLSAVDLSSGAVSVVASGLDGPDRGLALNAAATRAYVGESVSGRLSVVDLATGNVQHLASGMGWPSGVAVTRDERFAFVSERNGGELSRVNLPTGVVTQIVSGLREPVQVVLNAAENKAFVAEFESGRLSVVDLPTRTLVRIASGFSNISGVAINARATTAYVTEWTSGELSAVNLGDGSITIIASGLSKPAGLDLNPLDTTAYVSEAGSGELSSVDLSTGAITRIAGGLSLPSGAAVDVPAECRGGFLGVGVTSGNVEPFGSKSVEVRFSALSLIGGQFAADIVIQSNDPANPMVKVPVGLTVVGGPNIEVSETGLEFGPVFISGRATRVLTVANRGTDRLEVHSIASDEAAFAAEPSSFDLAVGASRQVGVTFAPGREGSFEAPLRIESNDPETPVVTVALSGTGRVPPDLAISPTDLNANLAAGTRAVRMLRIENAGGSDLSFALSIDETLGGGAAPWLTADPISGIVAAGVAIDVALTFDATGLVGGDYEARIVVTSNDPDAPPVALEARLHVTGEPRIALSRSVLNFGPVFIGGQDAWTFTVTNSGTDLLRVSNIRADDAVFTATPLAFDIPFAASRQVTVTFAPDREGPFESTLTIASNATGTPVVTASLSGTGRPAPAVDAQPRSMSAIAPVGQAETRTLIVSNGGGSPLEFGLKVRAQSPDSRPTPCGPRVLVTQSLTGELSDVDPATGTIARIAAFQQFGPTGIALDPRRQVAYVAEVSTGTLWSVDLVTRTQQPVATGLSLPFGIAVDPSGRVAYVTENSAPSRLAAVDLSTGTVTRVSRELGSPRALALSSGGTAALVADQVLGGLVSVDLTTGAVTPIPALGLSVPGGIALAPDGTTAYVTDEARGELLAVNLGDGQVRTIASGLSGPHHVALDLEANVAYVSDNDSLSSVNLSNGSRTRLISLLYGAFGVAVHDPVGCSGGYLRLEPEYGRVEAHASLAVSVVFDTAGYAPGDHQAEIDVNSNDPLTPSLTIPITLTVSLEPPNHLPVAAITSPSIVECNGPAGGSVTLDASASSDADSTPGTNDDIVSFAWLRDPGTPAESPLGDGRILAVTLPLGPHTIGLVVTDSKGGTRAAQTSVTVRDTMPPSLTLTADQSALWPPNHRLVPVHPAWQVSDRCDPAAATRLVSVTSSEPDDAPGSGDGGTTGDIGGAEVGTPDAEILLRAERDSGGPGRTYAITYAAVDASGNSTSSLALVTVPHDLGQGPEPLSLRLEPAGGMAQLYWNAVSGAQFYDMISGDVAALEVDGNRVMLGGVLVPARLMTQTSLTESGGAALPPVGHAFFYLVEYRDVHGVSGFGTESASLPLEPLACEGGCPGSESLGGPPGGDRKRR